MSKPKVVFEPVPSRYRVENRIRGGKWVDGGFRGLLLVGVEGEWRPVPHTYRVWLRIHDTV